MRTRITPNMDTSHAVNFDDKFIVFLNRRANTSASSLRNFPATFLVSGLSKIFLITFSDTFDNSKSLDTLHEALA